MTKTVLIIGASGNVGSEVITRLSASNNTDVTLRAVSRSAKGNTYDLSMNGQKIEQAGMDYNKPESIVKALKNVCEQLYSICLTYLSNPPILTWRICQRFYSNTLKVEHIFKSMTRCFGVCRSCFWTATYRKNNKSCQEKCPVDSGNVEELEIK